MRFGYGINPSTVDFSRAFDGGAVCAWLQNLANCDRATADRLIRMFQESKAVVTFYL